MLLKALVALFLVSFVVAMWFADDKGPKHIIAVVALLTASAAIFGMMISAGI